MDDTQLTVSEEKDDSEGKEVYKEEKKNDNNFYKIIIVVSIVVGVIGLGYAIKKMTDKTSDNSKEVPKTENKGLPSNIIPDVPSTSTKDDKKEKKTDDDKEGESIKKGNIVNNIKKKESAKSLSKNDIFKNNIESVKEFIKLNKKYSKNTK